MSENPTTPRTRLLGAAMVVAPVLLLASTTAYAAGGGVGDDQAGGTLQVYAMAAFALALFGLTGLLEKAWPRTSAALTALAMLGVAGGVGFGVDAVVYAYDPAAALSENPESASSILALFVLGPVFPLTCVATGLALARSGVTTRWSGLALALGGVLFPVSRIGTIEALAAVADAVLLVGLAPLGWSVLTGRRSRRLRTAAAPDRRLAAAA